MVLTPQQVRETILRNGLPKLKSLEKQIDEELLKRFESGQTDDVCIDMPGGISYNSPLCQALVQKYEQAGWNVKYESDQREGDFLRFTTRRSVQE